MNETKLPFWKLRLPPYHHYHRIFVKDFKNMISRKCNRKNNSFILTPLNSIYEEPSAFESEILPLHKSAIYDKGFRPPEALRGLVNERS